MAIIKNEIPILEFDTSSEAVIMPNHEKLDIRLPEKAIFAFLYDEADKYASKHNSKLVGEFISNTKNFPVYVSNYKGEDICFCHAPVGASASAAFLDWLISYGVKKILSVGSCGTLIDLPENKLLIPYKALRDEGTSYHYVKPSRYMDLDLDIVSKIELGLKEKGFDILKVITWSTDGFYRETKEKVLYRLEEGCKVVEMECASLAAVAQLRKAKFGQILYSGDTLADIEKHDARSFGKEAREFILEICFEIIRKNF